MLKRMAALAMIGLSACNKKSSESRTISNPLPDKAIINVAGTWDSFDGTDPNHAVFNLTQTATAVQGSFNLNSGQAIGTISGSADTDQFKFTLTEPSPCSGSFTGAANLNKDHLQGNLKGSDCSGAVEVVFDMHRI